jgi:hypothetical protein
MTPAFLFLCLPYFRIFGYTCPAAVRYNSIAAL